MSFSASVTVRNALSRSFAATSFSAAFIASRCLTSSGFGGGTGVLGLVETAAGTFTFVSSLGHRKYAPAAARAAATANTAVSTGFFSVALRCFGSTLSEIVGREGAASGSGTGVGGATFLVSAGTTDGVGFPAPGGFAAFTGSAGFAGSACFTGGTDSRVFGVIGSPPPGGDTRAGSFGCGGSIAGGAAADAEITGGVTAARASGASIKVAFSGLSGVSTCGGF